MFHANLKIGRFKKKKKHSSSTKEVTVQKDDEFLGNLLKRCEVPSPGMRQIRLSVTGDPFDLEEAELACKYV